MNDRRNIAYRYSLIQNVPTGDSVCVYIPSLTLRRILRKVLARRIYPYQLPDFIWINGR